MQWSAGRNSGFSDGEPWLPLAADHETRNVEKLREDSRSILMLYRRLIALRREHPALSIGDYVPGGVEGDVFWFERRHNDLRLIVVLNFGHEAATIGLPGDLPNLRILLSTSLDREDQEAGFNLLRGGDGLILAA
jgi:glycosidase